MFISSFQYWNKVSINFLCDQILDLEYLMKVIPKCNDYLYLHMKIDIFIEILNIVRGKAKVSIAILVFEFNSAA
jgi:hypothetical protein